MNNDAEKGRQEPYKTPSAGKKNRKRDAPRCMRVTACMEADRRRCHECDTELGNAGGPHTRTAEDMELGRRGPWSTP